LKERKGEEKKDEKPSADYADYADFFKRIFLGKDKEGEWLMCFGYGGEMSWSGFPPPPRFRGNDEVVMGYQLVFRVIHRGNEIPLPGFFLVVY